MNRINKYSGFSLTEMMIAVGIMAIGMVIVATIFPVGIKLTSMATERTLGSVVADEAFAKIRLYGMRNFSNWPSARIIPDAAGNLPNPTATYYTSCDYRYSTGYTGPNGIFWDADDNLLAPGLDGSWGTSDDIKWDREFIYPSASLNANEQRKYCWSAICRRTGQKDIQVTVFVSRKSSNLQNYFAWNFNPSNNTFAPATINVQWPSPVRIAVTYAATAPKELKFNMSDADNVKWSKLAPADNKRIFSFFGEGFTIVDDYTGKKYKILEMKDTEPDTIPEIILTEKWQWPDYESDPLTPPVGVQNAAVWVVPPAVGSGRYPCIDVYQRIINFDEIN